MQKKLSLGSRGQNGGFFGSDCRWTFITREPFRELFSYQVYMCGAMSNNYSIRRLGSKKLSWGSRGQNGKYNFAAKLPMVPMQLYMVNIFSKSGLCVCVLWITGYVSHRAGGSVVASADMTLKYFFRFFSIIFLFWIWFWKFDN